ncbi:hypothetical protein [Natronococcus wangiae]|uniref:hypothetical protein n=1 Tax=Natronococcus wangiae TaxID=3068275 RepID=UPI00273E96BB|nr:hypothetical protein [Natronococcus sp. AD5]
MARDAGTDEVDELFWRDEVLEAMYWMIGEGIEEAVATGDLRGFLDAPADVVERTFADLEARERIRETPRGYVFTESGEREAKRRFADEFAEMQGFTASHTDCGPDCWCHDPDHAAEECPSEHDHAHH